MSSIINFLGNLREGEEVNARSYGTMEMDVMEMEAPNMSNIPRYVSFMMSHWGFLLCNFLNVSYLLLIEGYVYGRLSKALLSKVALVGMSFQFLSCIASVIRYNIMDEYNQFFGKGSVILSVVGYCCVNFVMAHALFPRKPMAIFYVMICLAVYILVIFVLLYTHWEEIDFDTFRPLPALSNAFTVICAYQGRKGIKNENIKIDEGVASKNEMVKIFEVIMLIASIVTIMQIMQIVAFIYTFAGMGYTAVAFVVPYLDRMDVFKTRVETKPLLDDKDPEGRPNYGAN